MAEVEGQRGDADGTTFSFRYANGTVRRNKFRHDRPIQVSAVIGVRTKGCLPGKSLKALATHLKHTKYSV